MIRDSCLIFEDTVQTSYTYRSLRGATPIFSLSFVLHVELRVSVSVVCTLLLRLRLAWHLLASIH